MPRQQETGLAATSSIPDGYEFPGLGSVYHSDGDKASGSGPFLSWADAIETAGFPRPSFDRNYVNKERWNASNMGRSTLTRTYVLFRVEDGVLALIGELEATDSAQAVELGATEAGRYASVPKASINEYSVAQRLVATPNKNGPAPESEEPPE